jgi:hypothetical protein
MAIAIDWGPRVIHVPKADMTLVQSTPIEMRELDLDEFRMALKDLEDGEEGMAFPDTHRHETESAIGGITYARKIEIINGYTVTFEDGQYVVNLVGANSNVIDRMNPNNVSARSANSAGLTSGYSLVDEVGDAFMDGQDIEAGLSFRKAMRAMLAALAGKLSGAGPGSTRVLIRNALLDSRNRIDATVDQYGNRSQVTLDLD